MQPTFSIWIFINEKYFIMNYRHIVRRTFFMLNRRKNSYSCMRYDTNVSVFQWEEEEENHSAKKNKQNRTITSNIDDAARRRLLRSISIHKQIYFWLFFTSSTQRGRRWMENVFGAWWDVRVERGYVWIVAEMFETEKLTYAEEQREH